MITIKMNNSQCSAKVSAQTLYDTLSSIEDCNPNAKISLLGSCPFIREITIDIDTHDFKGIHVSYFGTHDEADLSLESHTIASALSRMMLLHCAD